MLVGRFELCMTAQRELIRRCYFDVELTKGYGWYLSLDHFNRCVAFGKIVYIIFFCGKWKLLLSRESFLNYHTYIEAFMKR